MTPAQVLYFLLCPLVIGPAYALLALYVCRAYRVRALVAACSTYYLALFGWFLSGMCAAVAYPMYPQVGPPEWLACATAIPGFIAGATGVVLFKNYWGQPARVRA